jgi:hypothetical protein
MEGRKQMAALNFRRRQTRRWWFSGVTLVVAAFFAVFFVVGASANLSGSTFEGSDGNLVVNTAGNTDWVNVVGRNTGIDTPSGSSDNAFGQGTKEDNAAVSIVDGSIPPNKNDLSRFYEASEQGSNGHIYLYLGWERLVNIGNANLDFEINKNPTTGFTGSSTGSLTLNRTAGDVLVTYDFGGSGAPTLGLNRWVTTGSTSQCFSANALPCWGNHIALGGNAEGAVNSGTIAEPLAGGNLGAGLFGEAAIDLTAAGVFQQGVCSAFGSTFLKSRSSSSFTAEIKDFIAPTPVMISNCGSITIHKVTENGDSSFGYSTTGGLSPSTFSLANGGTQAYNPANPGSYSVTENLTAAQQTAGWTLKDLSCTATGSGTSATPSGATVNITEGFGGVVDCTYTNHINVSPTISTTLSATTINLGQSVTDSSTLTGATSTAGGTVTYSAYAGASTCSGTDLLNSAQTVTNGTVPGSASFTPTAAGNYSFQAVYSGDANNNGATSVCSTEQLLVKANPTITTSLSKTTANIGDSITDSSTLHNATANAGGTVTYHAYAGANTCTGTDLLNSQKTVMNGTVPGSDAFTPTTAGNYSFQAVYSGDANNNGNTSVCSTEQLLVKTNPSITTTLSSSSVDVGSTVHDSSALSGTTSDATGTVTYTVYTNNTCSANPRDAGTKALNADGSVPDSNGLAFNTTGTFYWQAVYSGDTKNNGATSACTSETLIVNPKQPTASTAQNLLPNDSFTLSGGFSPTGSITFNLYSPSAATCSGPPAYTQTVPVNGNGTYPTTNSTFLATAEGTWRWQSSYSGDGNNLGASSTCGTERFTIANS